MLQYCERLDRLSQLRQKKATISTLLRNLLYSTAIEYRMERNCDLDKIGGFIMNKGFGIAMPRSEHRETFTSNFTRNVYVLIFMFSNMGF